MIQGKTPEITIKFSSIPELPTEGKKVTVEILSENGIKVKAELNRKTLKKQVVKMEEYSSWVGAMSGKIKSLDPEGMIELESAGIQVFEKKNTNKETKSEGGSQVQFAKSSSAAESDKIKSEEAPRQTLDSKQVEKESKIEKLIATATSPRDKAFYQELLQKTIAERKTTQVESTKLVNSSDSNSAKKKEAQETSAEKNQPSQVIFQAVGVIEGQVESEENRLRVGIGESSYELRFVPGAKKRQWSKLKQEIEEKGSSLKTLIVYPQVNLDKKGAIKFSFALSSIKSSSGSVKGLDFKEGEFKLAGIWQYSPQGNKPCITIRRNWSQGFVSYLEKIDEKQKGNMLRANYLPVDWKNPPTEAFKYSEETLTKGKKPEFVIVKAVFEPEVNQFKVLELLAEPSQDIPKYLKA